MILWRLSRYTALDGAGGLNCSARWHIKGRPIVYTAMSPAGALLEVLVHLDLEPSEIPDGYRLLGIDVPDAVAIATSDPLPAGWQHDLAATRALGDAWLTQATFPLLRVPSVIIGHTEDVLINPALLAATPLTVVHDEPFAFDERLL